ncbi:MAG: electron transfer flavoprotein subunit alpha [Candidatus Cloacimonadales bacterium]|jgi:electron transfer flavoprotein alpha subunit|nr:electron transfer flavoprotein subunit alpha [Candidatus Cloacimonadota bacterium]MDD2649549.1 electron transfer flavoprotein subunit alpha [Candidatus Cloacimonadota bacterium]MDX9977431.1 electron transfer flavoprotein subunit alpha [Candidatus Cloacimonadales bacterium]
MIEVIIKNCVGCGACVQACAYNSITIIDEIAQINHDTCTLCGACISACSFEALVMKRENYSSVNKEDYKGVWVFAEQRNNIISPVVFELLGKGRELAEKRNTHLTAVLLSASPEKLTDELIACGADRVIVVNNPEVKDFTDQIYTSAFLQLSEKYKPEIILAGASNIGRSFVPRVAVKLHTGLTADCTGLDIDPETGNLMQTRPAFGGNIMATILTPNHRPQIATVRHKVMVPFPKDDTRKGEVIVEKLDFEAKDSKVKFLESVQEEGYQINITEADIVVSGGRGLKEAKNFELLKEFAKLIEGAVGASRAAVDSEWIPYPHQVGQTGKTIKPKIYIAVGISGAIQHLAGMQSADYIIAINKDKDAPIFQAADLGLVGDLFEILPLAIKRFNQ